MTQPEPEQPESQPDEDNRQVWETTIHVEAEVIPGDPEED